VDLLEYYIQTAVEFNPILKECLISFSDMHGPNTSNRKYSPMVGFKVDCHVVVVTYVLLR
jgi:hypothetical protein